jgi:hypothetical protein
MDRRRVAGLVARLTGDARRFGHSLASSGAHDNSRRLI